MVNTWACASQNQCPEHKIYHTNKRFGIRGVTVLCNHSIAQSEPELQCFQIIKEWVHFLLKSMGMWVGSRLAVIHFNSVNSYQGHTQWNSSQAVEWTGKLNKSCQKIFHMTLQDSWIQGRKRRELFEQNKMKQYNRVYLSTKESLSCSVSQKYI